MMRWSLLIAILISLGCDHGSEPVRRIPPDRYDGSLFDARRPFDPANPRKPGGYGYGSSYGSGYDDTMNPSQEMVGGDDQSNQPDGFLGEIDAGLMGGSPSGGGEDMPE